MRNGQRRQGRATGAQQALLEREEEFALLADRLAEVRVGDGGVVLIESPPGMGRTRLLDAAGDMARDGGMRVLCAYGSELERALPFGVAMQLLEPLWRSAAADEQAALVSGPAQRAHELLTGSVSNSARRAEDETCSIIHGLFWLCANLCALPGGGRRVAPVTMLVDDVQWADAASLRFLAYLARRIDSLPLAAVLTMRSGEPTPDDVAVGTIGAAGATTRVRPAALSRPGVTELVSRRFRGVRPDPGFAEACARVTGGNPFLLTELLEQVCADGHGPDAEVAQRLPELVPEAVLASVARRLASLCPEAQRVAVALAVLGDGASLQHTAKLADLAHETLARGAVALAAAHFIHHGAPLSFVRPLERAAVLRTIAALDRARAHRRAAEILHDDNAPQEAVAAHLLAAPPQADPGTIEILRSAARSALAKGAADTAVRMLERAMAEQPDASLYPELLCELAEAELAAGLPHGSARLEQAIGLMPESPRRSRLALTHGRTLIETGRYREAAEVLDGALDGLQDSQAQLADELEGAYIAAAYRVPELAEKAAARAAEIQAGIGENPTPGERLVLAHMAVQAGLHCEPRANVVALVNAAWDGGAPSTFDDLARRSMLLAASALLFCDELERGLVLGDATTASARDQRSPSALAAAAHLRAWPRYEQGLIDDAAQDAQAALEAHSDRWEIYGRSVYGVIACSHIQRGHLDEAETALSILDLPTIGESVGVPFLLNARAQLRLAQTRAEAALCDALEAGRQACALVGATSPGVIAWRSNAALAHLALGDRSRAWDLVDEELELARRGQITRVIVRDLRIQGLIVRGRAGIDHLAEAVRIGDEHPRRLEHILALADLGAALRRSNQRSAATEPLRRALDLARQGGLSVIAERARTELLACGARARRTMLTGVEALTPSQRRVADLAADGLTTRMIAESLFITPKTVEFHLRQVYQKLQIHSRAALTAQLQGDTAG